MGHSKVRAVSEEHGIIEFTPILNNAKNVWTTQAKGSFGAITVNEIKAVNQRIWHSQFKVLEDTNLSLTLLDEKPSLRFLFSLKENMKFQFTELGKGIRLKHQFDLLYNRESDIQYCFRAGKEYSAVVVFLKYDWLLSWKEWLPELGDLIQNIDRGKSFFISGNITVRIRTLLQELLSTRTKREIVIEAKVLELLDAVIDQIFSVQKKTKSIKLSSSDISKIEEAKNHIEEHVANPGTILQLAKQIGLNDYKLKMGFKQTMGFTIHNFLLQERMVLANKLLKNPELSVKEIAKKVGFKSYPYFVKAYKKIFGYSPHSIRRARMS